MTPIPFQTPEPSRLPRGPRPSGRPPIARTDPRWLLAVRAALFASGGGPLPAAQRERLLESARRLGFAPIHAAAVLAIAERAALRGGLDHTAAIELAEIPSPTMRSAQHTPRVLGGMILVLVVAVVVVAFARFG